jgi:uncharacterized protein YlbG (UPF0298 family)
MGRYSMIVARTGLIVWLSDPKSYKALEKYGALHYFSKKMNYAVLYVSTEYADDVVANLTRLPYVKAVELSHRHDIKTEYSKNTPDKTRSCSI